MLLRAGEQAEQFFVVTAGRIEIVREAAAGEQLVIDLLPGQFSGEVSTLSGRRAFVTLRAVEEGEVIEVGRDELLALVQADSELSDLFVRAYLLRRGQPHCLRNRRRRACRIDELTGDAAH